MAAADLRRRLPGLDLPDRDRLRPLRADERRLAAAALRLGGAADGRRRPRPASGIISPTWFFVVFSMHPRLPVGLPRLRGSGKARSPRWSAARSTSIATRRRLKGSAHDTDARPRHRESAHGRRGRRGPRPPRLRRRHVARRRDAGRRRHRRLHLLEYLSDYPRIVMIDATMDGAPGGHGLGAAAQVRHRLSRAR